MELNIDMESKSLFKQNLSIAIFIGLTFLVMACRQSDVHEIESLHKHFITRDVDKLMEGSEEFRFAGANMPGMSLPYDYTLRFTDRLVLPTPWEQEDGFKTLVQMNARVVRFWNLPVRGPEDDWMDWAYVQGPGKFNEESFKAIDHALALANKYGIRIIFSLSAEWGDYLGGIGEYAAWREVDRSDFYTNEQCKADFKATINYVINRRNSVTGQLYRDDKAILAWQLGNELRKAPLEWEGEMADYIKSLDPNHLVMAGNDSRVPEDPPANLDILVRHYYGGDWVANCGLDRSIAKGKRPFIVGEYGLTSDVTMTREFYDEALKNGTSGHLIWSMYFHHRQGGFYWHQIFTHPSIGSFHWPGFASGSAHNEREMLHQLRSYAFKMSGSEIVPIPVPESPKLLPLSGSLPLLTWRGAAGASGYNVERAENSNGPWELIAEDVSDAIVAYRPLFADKSAIQGEQYYYRVSAKNKTGSSGASNVLGPVTFQSRLLVDEFHDFELTESRSGDLAIDNDYNGLYGEYLFRAKGDTGDVVTYQVEGNVKAIRLLAFFGEDISTPKILTSASGDDDFQKLELVKDKLQQLSSFEKVKQLKGMKRTLIEFSAIPKSDAEFIRIQWDGPMELDRVEIEYTD